MLGMRINTPVKLNTAAWQRPSSISGASAPDMDPDCPAAKHPERG
ncbi:hypothetical protein chiPu_0022175, partial [Chiloscyllium punctatum]|nr:hypothetical protein [Chiloscyllium punctatum]